MKKKEYMKPEVITYGDIQSLTLQNGPTTAPTDVDYGDPCCDNIHGS